MSARGRGVRGVGFGKAATNDVRPKVGMAGSKVWEGGFVTFDFAGAGELV